MVANKFFRKVLGNGMTIFLEKRDLPVVSVAYGVRSGGMNETASEKGISHFIEHMIYKGTKRRKARQIAAEIEQKGGELNGFTDHDITAFWCKMPSKHLDTALDVLTDMIKNSVFDPKELEKERKVIFEEIKMRRDSPNIYAIDQIHSLLFEKPFGSDLIGTHETMNSITREKIMKRFSEVYRPNNLILGVVGNADFSELVKFAEKNFGKEKGDGKSLFPKITKKNDAVWEKRKGIDQVNLVFSFHVPLLTDKRCHAAYVLNTIMTGGMSSRLFSEIREKRNLAYAVEGNSSITNKFAYNLVYVGTSKDKAENVKSLILAEFQKVSKKLSEKELATAKEQIIGDYEVSGEKSNARLHDLLQEEIDGNAGNLYKLEENIRNVKLSDVKELADIKNYSLFVLVPE